MQNFLKDLATRILELHSENLDEVTVVLPSTMAGGVFKKCIAEQQQRTSWLPKIFTMKSFLEDMAGQVTASRSSLMGGLYVSLQNLNGDKTESFDDFLKWSGVVLNDFSDIDQNLADANVLFSDLRNISQIEDWSFRLENLGNLQKQYADFWLMIGKLYFEFAEWQKKNGVFSFGLVERNALHNMSAHYPWKEKPHLYVAGFNALTTCEENVFFTLCNEGRAELIWDADAYYVHNTNHEAGTFLREYFKKMKQPEVLGNSFSTTNKFISFHQCSGSVAQSVLAASLLKEMSNDTAIVLADVALAEIIALTKLPPGVQLKFHTRKALGKTDAFKLVEQWMALICDQIASEEQAFHAEKFISVLHVNGLDVALKYSPRKLAEKILMNKWVYLDEPCLKLLAAETGNPALFSQLFVIKKCDSVFVLSAASELLNAWMVNCNDSEKEIEITTMFSLLDEISVVLENFSFIDTPSSLQKMISIISGSYQVSSTDGKEGIPVFDLLDTKALGYDHVIILGANEGSLPATGQIDSFIPADVRRLYQLPLTNNRDALVAYDFYRLLQHSSKAAILYSTVSNDYTFTEPSRYIRQLQFELPKANEHSKLEFNSYQIAASLVHGSKRFAEASPITELRIKSLFEHGISPSALNTFIRCPLDFYFQYILGLGEIEEIHNTLQSSEFGTVIHNVLEDFLRPFIGKFPLEAQWRQFENQAEELVHQKLKKLKLTDNLLLGENYLITKVAVEMIRNYSKYERGNMESSEMIPTVEAIEEGLIGQLDLTEFLPHALARIKGRADRIDRVNGEWHIIDYKTGGVKQNELTVKYLNEDILNSPQKSKLFQLLTYAWCYTRTHSPSTHLVKAGIFSFRYPSQGVIYLRLQDSELLTETMMHEFEEILKTLLGRIVTAERFEHNRASEYCKYCNN